MSPLPPRGHRVVPMSGRQRDVYVLLCRFHEAAGEAPSERWLARRLNVHLSTVQALLLGLYRRGWLKTPTPDGLLCTHLDPS